MPRFSANLGFLWNDRPLLDRIAAAGKAGFKAVELQYPYDVPAEQARAAAEAAGLRILQLNTPVNIAAGEFGIGAVAGREADFRAGFAQAAAYARAAGAPAVHAMAGSIAGDKARAADTFAANLAWAAAEAPDLILMLEPINQRDRPGYFYSTAGEAADMMDRVGAPNLRMQFDVYHIGVTEGGVIERLERHFPRIGNVQIAAVPHRGEPDEGEIDYRTVFSALERLGYAGWVGCEYKPGAGGTDAGLARWTKALGVTL